MKNKLFPDGRLNAIFRIEQNIQLADRLKVVKPSIDSSCPKTFGLFSKKFSKCHEKGTLSNLFS